MREDPSEQLASFHRKSKNLHVHLLLFTPNIESFGSCALIMLKQPLLLHSPNPIPQTQASILNGFGGAKLSERMLGRLPSEIIKLFKSQLVQNAPQYCTGRH